MTVRKLSYNYLFLSLILAFFLVFLSGNVRLFSRISTQTDRDSIKSKFDAIHRIWPGERLFIQTDKPLYDKGETIWFSVFVADEARLTLPGQSEIVYVEWINPKGAVEKKLHLIARGGKGNGDFFINADLPGGLYKLKAYTRWSEARQQFFMKEIQIQEVIIPNLKMKLELDRQAYAEGDKVEAKLEVNQLNNKALENGDLDINLMADGKILFQEKAKTNIQGKYDFSFPLPQMTKGAQPLLTVRIEGAGQTEMISKTVPMVDKEMLVYFFPEGGDYILGNPSRIGIKVLKLDSTSADAEGWLKNQHGDKIQYIKTLHRGMGFLQFTPKAGETYSIHWKSPVEMVSALPEAVERGFSLRKESQNDSIIDFQVYSPFEESATLVAQMRGRWLWDKILELKPGVNTVQVPVSKWQAGVVQFTLFDSRQVPRCERLVFVQSDRRLQIKVKTDKEAYQTREKVNLSVRAMDDRGLPVSAAVSVAVVNDALLSYADDKQGNLLSSLLLEQDLQTKLEDPSFYFGKDAKAQAALDLVMMTYGWRGFTWKKMLTETVESPGIRPQKAVLSGTVMDDGSGKPLAGAKLTMGEISVMTDAEGRFRFPFVDLSQHARLKIEKEGMPPMEQGIVEYNDQLVLHYWPYLPVQREMIPMANGAVELADVAVVEKKGVKRAKIPVAKMRKEAILPAPAKEKAEEDRFELKKELARRPFPGGGAPPIVPPQQVPGEPIYYRVKLFPNLPPAKSKTRSDFKTTLFWSGLVDLDANGRGSFSFYTGDDISSYRTMVQGIGPDGLVGVGDQLFYTELPLSISAKLPVELTIGDMCKLPVLVSNQGNKSLKVNLETSLPKSLKVISGFIPEVVIGPNQKKEILLEVRAMSAVDSAKVVLKVNSGEMEDEWTSSFRIVPRGYPVQLSFSGREIEKSFLFSLKNIVPGSIQAKVTAFPDVTSDLLAGVESILSEPYGCFEQTSMTSYPNVLALNYLRNVSQPDKALVSRAEGLLEKGYKRLVGFETKEKGYEWFGGSPAHEALTAYGLLQFKEMEKVAGYVDKGMIDRTAQWLLSRRDGRGGFLRSAQALDNFGRASEAITNAYIVYSLAEAGYQNLDQELEKVLKSATDTKDPYIIALATNTLWLIKRTEKAREFTKMLINLQKDDGSWMGLSHSITYSQGQALGVETTSFALLAILRSEQPERERVEKAVKYLCSQRQGKGGFGNSQATIVALKALTSYVVFAKRTNENGQFTLTVNQKIMASASWKAGEQKAISRSGWEDALKEGENRLDFRYSILKDPLPYTLGISYFTQLPEKDPNSGISLQTRLSGSQVNLGKPLQLTVSLKNLQKEGRPMVVAIIPLPGGCVVSPSHLKELMQAKKVDFYEINGNRIHLYYRQMAPEEEKVVVLNLSPVLKGRFTGSASSAYLYYTAERKEWAKPIELTIN